MERNMNIMEFQIEKNRIYMNDENGKLLAEITYAQTGTNVFTIDHTFVDDSLRGQGMADKLIRTAISEIQNHGGRVAATCSYAINWLGKHPEVLK